ncbi:MAG: YncE family protein [Thermomicrobiales bacterium]
MIAQSFSRRFAVCLAVVLLLAPAGALAKPGHEEASGPNIFTVRPEGSSGPLVAYDMASGAARYELPAGMLAADGSRYAAAAKDEGGTLIHVFDMSTDALRWQFPYNGRWNVRGISPTGRWVALIRIPSDSDRAAWTAADTWQTDVRIIDTDTGFVANQFSLDGNFEVETISPDGNSLFLVQHLPAINPDHYLIRLYDLATEALDPNALRDKKNTDEIMAGLAWEGVASPNGQWLLTLYLNTLKDTAFIHTLDLINSYPVCIDLPSTQNDMESLKAYTLSLSPDGQTAYAANAVLGVVAEVDLFNRVVRHVATFAPEAIAVGGERQQSRSAMSPDGSRLYFATGRTVWAYDTASAEIAASFPIETTVAGLGVSPDGNRLFIAGKDASPAIMAIDTATGARVTLPRA